MTPSAWYLSTKPPLSRGQALGQDQHDPPAWALQSRRSPGRQGTARPLAHADPGLRRGRLFLAALRHDRITAPCVIDGPINGTSFRAYVEQFLVPTLSSGDVVVMDNLGSHKSKVVRRLIRAAGAKLFFLPAIRPTSIRSNKYLLS